MSQYEHRRESDLEWDIPQYECQLCPLRTQLLIFSSVKQVICADSMYCKRLFDDSLREHYVKHLLVQCVLVARWCPTLGTPWTVPFQFPLSMGSSRQEYWRGELFPSPGDLPNPRIKPGSPALQEDSLPSETPGGPRTSKNGNHCYCVNLHMVLTI